MYAVVLKTAEFKTYCLLPSTLRDEARLPIDN
jgi:hypothetical protein